MELKDLRVKIDAIDDEMIRLFQERMKIAADVAAYKKENGMAVLDKTRERQKLNDIVGKTDEEFKSYAHVLYSLMFELSRSYQNKLLNDGTSLQKRIADAVESTEKLFPRNADVACQGVEGAYSQIACEKMFTLPNIMYFNSFEAVFAAIDQGLCRYGVLPLENSTAGSVNKVYDLMIKYDFNIVRAARLKVDHNLLAKKGTKTADIKEIYSHEQALGQCSKFLSTLQGVKIVPCDNTAVAAKSVFTEKDPTVAAIASHPCAELYGLKCLNANIQDSDNNYTRFIVISKGTELYAGANRLSLIISCDNKPGALYDILAKFQALGVNMTKLESCPVSGSNFEFNFIIELEANVRVKEVVGMLSELERTTSSFRMIGCYSEV